MVLTSLGGVLQAQGQFDQARESLERSANIEGELGNISGRLKTLLTLANLWRRLGKLEDAAEALTQIVAAEQVAGNRHGEAKALTTLGRVNIELEQYDAASVVLAQALAIAQDLGDQRGQAIIWLNIGISYADSTRLTEALSALREAERLERQFSNPKGLIKVLMPLTNVLRRLQQFAEAREVCLEGLLLEPDSRSFQSRLNLINLEEERLRTLQRDCEGVVVKWQRMNHTWAWGFIRSPGIDRDIWFGADTLDEPTMNFAAGDRVRCDFVIGDRGPRATVVRLISPASAGSSRAVQPQLFLEEDEDDF